MGKKKHNFVPARLPKTAGSICWFRRDIVWCGRDRGHKATPPKAVARTGHHGEATAFEYASIETSNAGRFAVGFQNANGVSLFQDETVITCIITAVGQ